MTHLLIALILAELFNMKKKSLVVLGALIPDILGKFQLILFYLGIPQFLFFGSFHTPLMSILVGILVAPLFFYDNFKTIVFINIGVISHFVADVALRHFNDTGMMLLFPFSMKNYSLNLIWPEQSLYVLFVTFGIYAIIKIIKKYNLIETFIS